MGETGKQTDNSKRNWDRRRGREMDRQMEGEGGWGRQVSRQTTVRGVGIGEKRRGGERQRQIEGEGRRGRQTDGGGGGRERKGERGFSFTRVSENNLSFSF